MWEEVTDGHKSLHQGHGAGSRRSSYHSFRGPGASSLSSTLQAFSHSLPPQTQVLTYQFLSFISYSHAKISLNTNIQRFKKGKWGNHLLDKLANLFLKGHLVHILGLWATMFWQLPSSDQTWPQSSNSYCMVGDLQVEFYSIWPTVWCPARLLLNQRLCEVARMLASSVLKA